MRRCGALLVKATGAAMLAGGASGCAQTAKETNLIGRYFHRGMTQSTSLTQSSSEHLHSLQSVADLDSKALLDDLDLFWQRDRGMRLSRWHER